MTAEGFETWDDEKKARMLKGAIPDRFLLTEVNPEEPEDKEEQASCGICAWLRRKFS